MYIFTHIYIIYMIPVHTLRYFIMSLSYFTNVALELLIVLLITAIKLYFSLLRLAISTQKAMLCLTISIQKAMLFQQSTNREGTAIPAPILCIGLPIQLN